MNTKQIIDRAWSLAIQHVRKQIKEPIKVGELSDMVRTEISNDNGLWLRRAMEEQ